MPIAGQIEQVNLALPYDDGFYLTKLWRYDEGLLPVETVFDDDYVSIRAIETILQPLLTDFPEEIAQGTEFEHQVTGSPWTTLQDAYLKEYNYSEDRNGVDDPVTRATVWGITARYSYTLYNDDLDQEAPPSYEPWSYPEGEREYVPINGWPDDLNLIYSRERIIAQETTVMYAQPPWGLYLAPDNTDAYNLINFGTDGSATVTDLTGWNTIEGEYPLDTLQDMIAPFVISSRIQYSGGYRYLYVTLFNAYYLDPAEGLLGFFYPQTAPPPTPVDGTFLAGIGIMWLFEMLLANVGNFITEFVSMSAKHHGWPLGDEDHIGILGDEDFPGIGSTPYNE